MREVRRLLLMLENKIPTPIHRHSITTSENYLHINVWIQNKLVTVVLTDDELDDDVTEVYDYIVNYILERELSKNG